MERKLYAAYGSNINVEQMSMRCPTAVIIGKAELQDYRLVFRGRRNSAVATIEPQKGAKVPLLVWAIGREDERALDRYEGFHGAGERNLYDKCIAHFRMNGVPRSAMVYVMSAGHEMGAPSRGYYDVIRQGYKDVGFPVQEMNNAVKASMNVSEAAGN